MTHEAGGARERRPGTDVALARRRAHSGGRPPRRLPERAGGGRHRRQGGPGRVPGPHRAAPARGDLLRARRRDPPAGRRRRRAPQGQHPRGGGRVRSGAQRARFGGCPASARAFLRGESVRVGYRVAQPREREPLGGGITRGAGTGARPRGGRGASLRGGDLGGVRLPLRGRRRPGAGVRHRRAAGGRGLLGDRLWRHHRDGQPRPGRASRPPSSAWPQWS